MQIYVIKRNDHDYDEPRGWVIRARSMKEAKEIALRDIKKYDSAYPAGVTRLKGRLVKVEGRPSVILHDFLNG